MRERYGIPGAAENLGGAILIGLVCLLAGVRPLAAAPTDTPSRTTMRVGVMQARPPIAFVYPGDESGALRGLAVDLATMLNRALGLDSEFRAGNRDELLTWLNNGDIDYICGLPRPLLPDGADAQSLTTSFATNRRILVGGPDVYIRSEQDYPGHTLALLDDSEQYRPVAEAHGARTVKVLSYQDGFRLLTSGAVDAFVVPSGEIASYLILMENVPGIRLMGLSLERYPTLLVTPPDQPGLKTRLSGELVRLEDQGTLEQLREKWYGRPLTREPGFWERHERAIVLGLGAGLAALALILAWTFLLRRRIAVVTRRLMRSEQRFKALLLASPDAIVSLDPGGGVRFANRSARRNLLEQRPSPFPFRPLDDTARTALRRMLDQAFAGHTARETVGIGSADGRREFEIVAFPSPDGRTGEPLACCIARDMTEQRRMEKELIQSERLAVIGKLAAGVAHEINNPLGIVRTNADIAAKLNREPAVVSRLDAIRRNVERASAITRRLLRLTVPDSLTPERVDLAEITRESLRFLQPRLSGVQVDLAGLPGSLWLTGDRVLLEQLILNLLLNALDSMDDKGRLAVSGAVAPSGATGTTGAPEGDAGEAGRTDGTVSLTIRDSGKGIPRADLEKIFDLFYTTRNSEGFGLGLFICKRIVDRHGGLIYAESDPGRGASLRVELPAGD